MLEELLRPEPIDAHRVILSGYILFGSLAVLLGLMGGLVVACVAPGYELVAVLACSLVPGLVGAWRMAQISAIVERCAAADLRS